MAKRDTRNYGKDHPRYYAEGGAVEEEPDDPAPVLPASTDADKRKAMLNRPNMNLRIRAGSNVLKGLNVSMGKKPL